MGFSIQTGAQNRINDSRISVREAEFRAEFNILPSWQERAQAIDERLKATEEALSARNEKLLALRGDFNALTLDFWRTFARSLGCEDPAGTIAQEQTRQQSWSYRGVVFLVTTQTVLAVVWCQATGSAVCATGALVTGILIICWIIGGPLNRIARARRASEILRREQEPFWLTGGNGIALSNLGITPPPGAGWCQKTILPNKFLNDLCGYVSNVRNGWYGDGSRPVESTEGVSITSSIDHVPYRMTRQEADFNKATMRNQVTFVFVRHLSARFTIDAQTSQLILEGDLPIHANRMGGLTGQTAKEILKHLLATNGRYRQLVNSFGLLVSFVIDLALLYDLRIEARQAMAEELRAAEQLVADLRSGQARPVQDKAKPEDSPKSADRASVRNASWDTLIIPQSLRENLKAYVRILRDYQGYQAVGVKLPKGLLLFGPPGCGKTQIAKTLSSEAGLNFVALSTSDCKAMWIGHSADRLANVFREAREKQPTLLFIDELDIVCPPRGAYHDCISQEFTGELLQQLDGIFSDSQAIFLVGATNRPDQVDGAILSRFSEQIEIPLPDKTVRAALLEVFLSPLRFSGDRARAVLNLTLATEGRSGRDLRALVTQAVLAGVKRTSSPKDFTLTEKDFALLQEKYQGRYA
jgi:AAA+ superfamily predicted ATPase